MKTRCKWRNSGANNIIYSKDCIAVIDNWQYTIQPCFLLPAARKQRVWRSGFLLWPTTNTARTNDTAKSTAASCIFRCVVLCAIQIKSSNMMCKWYFYTNILEERCVCYMNKHSNVDWTHKGGIMLSMSSPLLLHRSKIHLCAHFDIWNINIKIWQV
jgi:hypothetical protein